MDDVVKCVTYNGDANARAELNAAFEKAFPVDPPARSSPVVDLPMGLLISVDAVAIAPDD